MITSFIRYELDLYKAMMAVIFEVELKDGKRQAYLDIAADLRHCSIRFKVHLDRTFESLTQPGKVLSLSFFRDEMAVAAWRSLE